MLDKKRKEKKKNPRRPVGGATQSGTVGLLVAAVAAWAILLLRIARLYHRQRDPGYGTHTQRKIL